MAPFTELSDLDKALGELEQQIGAIEEKLVKTNNDLGFINGLLEDSRAFKISAQKDMEYLKSQHVIHLDQFSRLAERLVTLDELIYDYQVERAQIVTNIGLLTKEVELLKANHLEILKTRQDWGQVLPFKAQNESKSRILGGNTETPE